MDKAAALAFCVHCVWQVSCILIPPFTECGRGCRITIMYALCLASQLHTDAIIHRMWTWLRHHHHVSTVFGKSAAYRCHHLHDVDMAVASASCVHCFWQVSCILMPPLTECGHACGISILCALCWFLQPRQIAKWLFAQFISHCFCTAAVTAAVTAHTLV